MTDKTVEYDGNCHCGLYRFKLTVPEITSAKACTCRLCRKAGYLWIAPPEGSFEVTRGEDCLAEYQTSALKHKFCKQCDVGVVGEHLTGPLTRQFVVNVRTLQGVNPFAIEDKIETVETHDDQITAWPFSSTSEQSEAKFYHRGTCVCGKMGIELLAPLSELEVKEDNCSSCVRWGYIGVYPDKDNIRIYGRDEASEYLFGKKYGGLLFCGTCGVPMYGSLYGPPQHVLDAVPEERKERVMQLVRNNLRLQPACVRALDEVDLKTLKIQRTDCGTDGYQLPP